MSILVLTDAFAHVDGHDFSCDTNNVMLRNDVAVLDATTFCSDGWTEQRGGLKSVTFDMSGFWQSAESGAVDPEVFPNLGQTDRVFTVGPSDVLTTTSIGLFNAPGTCYMFRAGHFNYQMFGEIGQLTPFQVSSAGTNGIGSRRGKLIVPKQTVTGTGQVGVALDTAFGFGTTTAYCAVHVFSAGTTITLQLQSDDNLSFSSPTTQATIGPLTAADGTWTQVVGPGSDRYYRLNVSAITGSFSIAAALG